MNENKPTENGFGPSDPLRAAWASQSESGQTPQLMLDAENLTESVVEAYTKDRRRLVRLSIQELLPGILVAGVFVSFANEAERPVANFVAAALVLTAVGFLVASTIIQERNDRRWGSSVRDQLTRRVDQVEHFAWMYRNILWWYILPITVAILLVRYGVGGELQLFDAIYFPLVFGFVAAMYWWNRRLGRKRYESEVARLRPLLDDFDKEN